MSGANVNKIFQTVYLTPMIFCLIAISSCTTVRKNNEKFFYRKTMQELGKSLTSKTRAVCGPLTSLKEPKFIYDPSIMFADGFTFYNEITYKNYNVIPHEAVHYLSFSLGLSQECMEEILGDVLSRLVHER